MQSGELIVSGQDQAVISLHSFPAKLNVRFGDEESIVPCSPNHADEVEWEVVRSNCNCHCSHHGCHRNPCHEQHECQHHGRKDCCHTCVKLIISWNVSGVREIIWNVFY